MRDISIGDFFVHKDPTSEEEYFMLVCSSDQTICLVSLKNGNRWLNAVKLDDSQWNDFITERFIPTSLWKEFASNLIEYKRNL